ncbi:MAG: hypothetical protein ABW168_08950 [Sedimenticola sp.]
MYLTDQKTIYTIMNEYGEKTTISINKDIADFLHEKFTDVHKFIQETYNRVVKNHPKWKRLTQGDEVRRIAADTTLGDVEF